MRIEEYFLYYQLFDDEFCPGAGIEEVERKVLEEMGELRSCLQWPEKSTHDETLGELLDVLNVTLKLLKRYGIHDPLHFGYQKLQLTAEKYRAAKQQAAIDQAHQLQEQSCTN